MDWDVIVVGVGGMGSAACWQLARRRPCACWDWNGSTSRTPWAPLSGTTRIIRLPYYEHQAYVPLLHRAYELWAEAGAGDGCHAAGHHRVGRWRPGR